MDDYRKIGIGLTAAGMLFFFLGIMLLVDLMFLDDSAFVFDPDPVNWRRRTERSY